MRDKAVESYFSVLFSQFRNFKIIYRRYAGLYFCICVDVTDNNLAYLEGIHNFVEVTGAHNTWYYRLSKWTMMI